MTFSLVNLYSKFKSQVKVANNDEEDQLRLLDDVFAKLCLMINDISVEVKVCANSSMVIIFETF